MSMKLTREKSILSFVLVCSVIASHLFAGQDAKALFEQPALMTSAGQSADGVQASVLAKRAELKADLIKFASGKDLENHKTLILVLGASMKGMGAAGLDTNKEKERIVQLLAEAKKKNIPVFCLHIGGEDRRGQLTDEMIAEYLPSAQAAIVVKSGNKDGIFTKICKEKNIPLTEVDKILDVVGPLKAAFKSQ
jgi:hypothetical protein